ncbi:uncharacterized protein [Battus philenor]|uniref:uncharacterized protein n=1 Tax=Battus philenor TaxID=42288 RepID=UPI0035D10907
MSWICSDSSISHQSTSSGSSEDSRFDRSTRDNLLNYRREVPFDEFNLASSENLQVETNIQENNYDAIQFPNNLFDGALRNQNELVNLQPKGRFKIAKDKRKEEKNEKKRKKTADGRGKKKKPLMELIEESHENLKKIRYDTREKKQKKPRPSSREIDIVGDLTRGTDKKISNSGEWKDTSRYNDSVNQARRPKKLYGKKSKFSERVIGRTFIPFIGKKTVYEDDK